PSRRSARSSATRSSRSGSSRCRSRLRATRCRRAARPRRRRRGLRRSSRPERYPSALEQYPPELVFLARLEDREHLVAGLEGGGADGDLGAAVAHHGDEPRALGQPQRLDALARDGRVAVDLHLDDLEVLLAQLEQVDEVVLGHLVLDESHDARGRAHGRRDAEQVEVRLVTWVVHTGDDLLDAVLLARELRDHEIVLVVAGEGEDDVGRPRDPGALEHVELGRVPALDLVLELVLEPLEAVALLLDERHLVPDPEERAGDVRADLAAAGDDRVHQPATLAGGMAQLRTASISVSIAVFVGQTTRRPRAV